MTRRSSILAGTALGLLMASTALVSAQPSLVPLRNTGAAEAPIILAQGEESPAAERLRKKRERQQKKADEAAEEEPAEETPRAEEPAEEPSAEEPAAEEAPAEETPAEEPAAESAPAEAPEPAAADEPAPEPEAADEPAPEPAPVQEPAAGIAPAEAAPTEAPAAEPEQPKRKNRREKKADQPAAAETPVAPVPTEPTATEPAAPAETVPAPAEQTAPAGIVPAPAAPTRATAAEPAPADQPAAAGQPAGVQGETVQGDDAEARQERRARRQRERAAQEQQAETAPAAPPPADDKAAQEAAQPETVEPVTAERGTRREERRERRERREGADVLSEISGRVILELGDQVVVESDEQPRLSRNAREVYYEDLPRGRVRETIIRENGVQVITVRDRYGDVIRRSRITPDGREHVLVYAEEREERASIEWVDPGDELPPLRLSIPREEYIFEAEVAATSEDYYEFLDQPPVEKVERLYSVDEVKRSARVRDKTRRIDLDTITFEFGSAEVPESQIAKLEGVATAMERLLQENPAETFLIEGHTDAVGSDLANLALSDRRAEAVAQALTDVFALPPENLTTQGYGEEYLKVNTEGPERENRRVGIRRITALVAPVASAQ